MSCVNAEFSQLSFVSLCLKCASLLLDDRTKTRGCAHEQHKNSVSYEADDASTTKPSGVNANLGMRRYNPDNKSDSFFLYSRAATASARATQAHTATHSNPRLTYRITNVSRLTSLCLERYLSKRKALLSIWTWQRSSRLEALKSIDVLHAVLIELVQDVEDVVRVFRVRESGAARVSTTKDIIWSAICTRCARGPCLDTARPWPRG